MATGQNTTVIWIQLQNIIWRFVLFFADPANEKKNIWVVQIQLRAKIAQRKLANQFFSFHFNVC